MVTKRKPVKRKNNAGARNAGHPASAAILADKGVVPEKSGPPRVVGREVTATVADASRRSGEFSASGTDVVVAAVKSSTASAASASLASSAAEAPAMEAPAAEMPIPSFGSDSSSISSSADESAAVDESFAADGDQAEQRAEAPSEAEEGEASDSSDKASPFSGKVGKKRKSAKEKQLKPWVRNALVASAAVMAVLLVLVGLYSWDRWFRYDDSLDLVGEWQIYNSQATVLIDGEYIVLAPDASLEYTLDTTTKTIHFTLGNMEGGGRYCFSADRNQLVIEDGAYGSWLANAWHDAGWRFNQLMHAWFGAPERDLSQEGLSAFNRAGTQATQADESAEQEAAPEEGSSTEEQPAENAEQTGEEVTQQADGEGAADGVQEQAPAEPQEEFQGSQASGVAGGNAVTLEELQGATA